MAAAYYVARGGEESLCVIDLANCCRRAARKTEGDFGCPKCGAEWIADRREEEVFGPPIHVYTRAEAIADEVLVDATETAREAGFTVPVALTANVWADVQRLPESGIQDARGRLWDLLFMACHHAARRPHAEVIAVELIMPVGRKRSYRAKLHVGPGDAGEPVATILRPDED